jgi:hypothetical protein
MYQNPIELVVYLPLNATHLHESGALEAGSEKIFFRPIQFYFIPRGLECPYNFAREVI